ncbi:unnamed protein product, partial [Ixodes hexagonus]
MVRPCFPWALLKRQPTVGDVARLAAWLPWDANVGRCVFLDKGQTSTEEKQPAYTIARLGAKDDIWSFSLKSSEGRALKAAFWQSEIAEAITMQRRRRGKRKRKGV